MSETSLLKADFKFDDGNKGIIDLRRDNRFRGLFLSIELTCEESQRVSDFIYGIVSERCDTLFLSMEKMGMTKMHLRK